MSEKERRRYSLFPKTLAGCIEPLTRPVLKAQGLAGSRILTEWESIVGPKLARHCVPEKLSFPRGQKTGGTLVISTENGFATELQHMQPIILERMAAYFGYQAITRITISHSWHTAAATPVAIKKRTPALPPDSKNLTADITDPELKATLESFASTLSGQ